MCAHLCLLPSAFCPDLRVRSGVLLLPCLDTDRQTVLGRRQRAGRVRSEGAGRVVGVVEVDDGLAVLARRMRVEITGRAVGLMTAGRVAEDEEQVFLALLEDRLDAVLLAI